MNAHKDPYFVLVVGLTSCESQTHSAAQLVVVQQRWVPSAFVNLAEIDGH